MKRRDVLKGLAASPLLAIFRPHQVEDAGPWPAEIVHLEPKDSPLANLVSIHEEHQRDGTPCVFDTQVGPCMNARHWPAEPKLLGGQRPAYEEAWERQHGRSFDEEFYEGDEPWEWDE